MNTSGPGFEAVELVFGADQVLPTDAVSDVAQNAAANF
jgi:hypothetical protein